MLHEFGVSPRFADPAGPHHRYLVVILDGAQPVNDRNHGGMPFQTRFEQPLDSGLGFVVQGRGYLVQDKNLRLF